MTGEGPRAILRASMRRAPALFALAAALLAAGCTSPCEELGGRLCGCQPTGTTRDTCERQVEARVNAANPDGDQEAFCEARLGTCNAPEGATFCEWVLTAAGKEACGLAQPEPAP